MPVTVTLLRRWLIAALLLAAGCAAPSLAQAQVVVVANGSPITAYDIEQRTKLIEQSSHKKPTRQEVIQDLIDDRIKIDKAKSYGLIIGDDDVNQAFEGMAQRQHITPQQFSQFLNRSGISPDTVKARIRAELTWGQLIRGKFNTALQVGESDVAVAMRARNEADTVGYIYTLYPVIVVVPFGSQQPVVEARRRDAENLRSRFLNCKEGLEMARGLRDVAVRELGDALLGRSRHATARSARQHPGRAPDHAGADAARTADVRGLRQEGEQDRVAGAARGEGPDLPAAVRAGGQALSGRAAQGRDDRIQGHQ